MDFGSKYVYKYNDSSEESVSEEEIEEQSARLELCVASEAKVENEKAEDQPTSTTKVSEEKKKKRLRKADTNIVSIKFNKLLQPGEMHAGDPVYCSTCGAIASHLSQIQTVQPEEGLIADAKTQWKCEFCPQTSNVDIEQSDLPKKEDATYLVEPAPIVHGSDMTGLDDSIVVFVVDTSGSMSSTTLIPGNFQLPNALQQQERDRTNFDGERMIRNRHQTYVSRLQGVQMAVEANLDKLVKETPTRRAVLLTFNHEITYFGDGTRDEPLVIRGDKLNSLDDIVREAEAELNQELKPISQTKTRLTERVYNLEEGGQTALGPAILFAINIASKRRGSRIVVCTDGLANRGLGNLETAQDEKVSQEERGLALEQGNEYYANMTERARAAGTTISVITIKGTTCLLSVIGQMADGTGGNVNIVDLLNIREEFASILEQKVIATNVEATLIVHRGLYIRDPDQPNERLEKVKRDIGNVTKQTEITFEFGIRKKEEAKEKYQIDLDQLKQLPFQIQVTYTASDGSKALRVLTQLKEATENREIAEINARRTVIAENHIRSTAHYMMQYSDDDDDEPEDKYSSRKRGTKWSSPTVQKQRLMYMSKLNAEREKNMDHISDNFSETTWMKANSALQSHVQCSKRRLKAQKNSFAATTTARSNATSEKPSLFQRVTNYFRADGSPKELSADRNETLMESHQIAEKPRSFGFMPSKLSAHPDAEAEDLYRLKNFTLDTIKDEKPTEKDNTLILPLPIANVEEKDDKSKKEQVKEDDSDDSDDSDDFHH